MPRGVRNLSTCRLPGIHQGLCIRQQFFTGWREAYVVAVAGKKIHTQLIFQLSNTKTDR